MLAASRGLAQEEEDMSSTTSALGNVLSSLKESVDKLSLDNDKLSLKDDNIKAQIAQLQASLNQLKEEEDRLDHNGAQASGNNPSLTQQIADLQSESSGLDNRETQAQNEIKLIRQALDAGYEENQRLLAELKGVHNLPEPSVDDQQTDSQTEIKRQKEKIKLMEMIYSSQQRQETLRQSILEYHKNTTLQPAAVALVHQKLLKERINDLEGQIADYAKGPVSSSTLQWDSDQLNELELMLKSLEKNYAQLKELTQQMSKKNQSAHMSVAQHVEEDKLKSSMEDLKRQGAGLRADLDDLRSQMVDLDKRKSRLESMVHQM